MRNMKQFTRRRFLGLLAPAALPVLCRPASAVGQAAVPVRVLFIGNSYTYVNELPKLFQAVINSSGLYLPVVGQLAEGGFHLSQHVDADKTRAILNRGAPDGQPWDVVVLQEQSVTPSTATAVEAVKAEIRDSAQRLASLVWAVHPQALIVLFQTWARHADFWKSGKALVQEVGIDSADMQLRTHRSIADVAKVVVERGTPGNARVIVSPVGDFWQESLKANPGLRLHDADGSHPSPAGSMLAASVLMASIGGRAALEKAHWNGPISKADAAAIRQLVLDHPELFSQAAQ